jgi:hypothetical protein
MGGGEGVIARGEGECWIEYRVQSTEDGGRKDGRAKVQIGAELLCKGGKGDDNQSTECWIEYGLRSAER